MKDKEKRITINRESGARVDLLNKEIEELQKAKAIEEMQNVVCKRLCNQDCRICNYYNKNDCLQKDNVEALYEQGYRKLPEDSVVLSKEEYEKLKHFENRVRSGVCLTQKEWFDFCNEDSNRRTCLRIEEREKERKETAEKILKYIEENFEWLQIDEVYDIHEFIAKQFGLEIKE